MAFMKVLYCMFYQLIIYPIMSAAPKMTVILSMSGVELFMNETSDLTVVLLPGLHTVNTTRRGILIRDIDSIIFTGTNDKAIVQCMNKFIFKFLYVEEIQVSNIVFNFCDSAFEWPEIMNPTYSHLILSFVSSTMASVGGRNIEVANITIEQGGIAIIGSEQCKNAIIHLHDLNITSNATGIAYHQAYAIISYA